MKITKLGFAEKIILIFILLICPVLVLLLTNLYRIGKLGSFGDAFNGLLAPIISLIGSLLVYISFKEQIRANNLLQSQWTFDLYLKIFEDIKSSFESISIDISHVGIAENPRTQKGLYAFYNLHYKNKKEYSVSGDWDALRNLEPVVIEFISLMDNLSRPTNEGYIYLRNKLLRFYESDLGKASEVVLKYFEDNQNRIKTMEANALLIIKLKELEIKMNKYKEQV